MRRSAEASHPHSGSAAIERGHPADQDTKPGNVPETLTRGSEPWKLVCDSGLRREIVSHAGTCFASRING
jgi:hypothetical protein